MSEQLEVRFENVELTRGGRPVLRAFQLAIAKGETLALVGRSGAGKSSVLKLINRMLLPDRGLVSVRGRRTDEWDPIDLRRQTGYVLQEIALFPHLSVAENVALVPRLLGWGQDKVVRTAEAMLTLVGLEPAVFAQRSPYELSGGERQRVGVARALAADPPLLLMDEPFGALDPITRSELHRHFLRIQQSLRKTVVIVTHDMAEAFALATRVAVLSDGRVIALDTPRGIAASNNPAVRPFLEPLLEATTVLGGVR
jgi:osmoprotectant transport system ATP-binding protein